MRIIKWIVALAGFPVALYWGSTTNWEPESILVSLAAFSAIVYLVYDEKIKEPYSENKQTSMKQRAGKDSNQYQSGGDMKINK